MSLNLLKTFPDDLHTQAPEVGKLNLSGNPMPEIPGCVLNCQQLKELYVKDLGLAVIQKGITQLKKLEILDISGHTLTQIPEEIGLLEKLTQLDISGIAWFSEYDNARSVLSRQAFDDVMAGNRITAGLSDKVGLQFEKSNIQYFQGKLFLNSGKSSIYLRKRVVVESIL